MKAVSKKTIAILDGFVGAKIYDSNKVIASYEIIDEGDDGRRLKIKFTNGDTKEYYKHIWKHVRRDHRYYDTVEYETLPKITKCGVFNKHAGRGPGFTGSHEDLIIDPSSVKMTQKEFDDLVNSKSIDSVCIRRSRKIDHLRKSIYKLNRKLSYLQDHIETIKNNLNGLDAEFSIGCYIPNELSDNSMSGISNHIKSFYKDVQITDKE